MDYQSIIKKKKNNTNQGEGKAPEGKSSDVDKGKEGEAKKKKEREKRAGKNAPLAITGNKKYAETIMGKIGNQYRNM